MKTIKQIYESILTYTHDLINRDWEIVKKALPKGVKVLEKDGIYYVVDPTDKTKAAMKYYKDHEQLLTDLTKVELKRILMGRDKEIKL